MKWNINLLILVAFGMVAVLPASAADEQWELYFRNSQGDEFYYDTQSVRKDEAGFRSLMLVNTKRLNARTDGAIKAFNECMQLDCSRMVYRRTELEVVRNDGSIYKSHQSAEWDPILADSPFKVVFDEVCNKAGRSRRR